MSYDVLEIFVIKWKNAYEYFEEMELFSSGVVLKYVRLMDTGVSSWAMLI